MNKKSIYLKNLIENIRNGSDSDGVQKLIKTFEVDMKMLVRGKGNYMYDDLVDELVLLSISLDLEKENLYGYIKTCLKNYSIKIIKKQNNKTDMDKLENIIFKEKDNIDRANLDRCIEKYLNNEELLKKLLCKTLKPEDSLLLIDYYINHRTIAELMGITSKKHSTIYNRLKSSKNSVENYIVREVYMECLFN